MANFYEELREARLAAGLSIEDISNVTKINPKYLHAIESGDYDLLPEPYIVLFIKAYAKEIGLDTEETARKYKMFRGAEQLPKEKRKARRKLAEGEEANSNNDLNVERENKKSNGVPIWVLFVVVIIAVIAVGSKSCWMPAPVTLDEPDMNSSESQMLQQAAVIDSSIDGTAADSTIADTLFAEVSSLAPPELMTLKIMSLDSVKIRVVVIADTAKADDISFRRIGEQASWEAYDKFSVRISKTRAVAIYLNGELLDFLGPENTWVSRAIITKDGVVPGQTILRTRR